MNFLKNIFKDTIAYSLITFLEKFVNYLIIPFLSKYICPENFGIISKIYTYIGILYIIYSYGLESTYFRFGKEKVKQIKMLILFSTTIFSIITFVILNHIDFFAPYLVYIILILITDAIILIPFTELINERKVKKYASITGLQTIVNVCTMVILIKYLKFDSVKSYLLGNILSNVIVFFFIKPFDIAWINKKDLSMLLSFSFPLLCVDIVGELNNRWTILSLDFFLPENFYQITKNSVIGIVSMNCKIASAINICIRAFRFAFNTVIFKKENDSEKVNQTVMHYFIVVMSLIWFSISMNTELIAAIFFKDDVYKQGLVVIPFMTFYHICNGVYYNILIYFKKINKTIFNFIFTVISFVVTVLLSFVLIPKFGVMGSLISNILGLVISIVLSYKKNKINYPNSDILWIAIPMIFIVLSHYFIKNFLLNILITIAYVLTVILFLLKTDSNLRETVMPKKKSIV